MEHNSYRRRKLAKSLKIGDKVWLNLKNMMTSQLRKKLSFINTKYKIIKLIWHDVYELDAASDINTLLFASLFRKYPNTPFVISGM